MIAFNKKTVKKVLKVIVIIISVFVVVSSVATKFVYDFIFDRYDTEYNLKLDENSKNVIDSAQQYSYKCGKNLLTGYLYKSDSESRSLVVIVPGFHSQMQNYAGLMYSFSQKGFDVFCFDSTGHGESGGDSSIGFPQINLDLRATMDFISQFREYDDVFLFGHSRGAYAACCLLENNQDISAVIAINGVNSAMDGIMAYSTDAVGNVAYINYPFITAYQNILFGTQIAGIKACEAIENSDVPVLIVQSEADVQLADRSFSIYSKKDAITKENVSFVWYTNPEFNGHTSVIYDENGTVNNDIVELSSQFFKQNS